MADPIILDCPRCSRRMMRIDFDGVIAALKDHPTVRLPPLPKSLLREAFLAQLQQITPYCTCGCDLPLSHG